MINEKVFIATDRQTLSELLKEIFVSNKKEEETPDIVNGRKTQREAAKFLGVSYQTVGNWTKAGLLKKHGHGRKFYFLESELIETINKSG